jgi:hypothetical protein
MSNNFSSRLLTPADIVVTDNLPAHKADGGRRLRALVASFSTSHPTARISTSLKKPFPSSSPPACANQAHRRSRDTVGKIVPLFESKECANYITAFAYDPE